MIRLIIYIDYVLKRCFIDILYISSQDCTYVIPSFFNLLQLRWHRHWCNDGNFKVLCGWNQLVPHLRLLPASFLGKRVRNGSWLWIGFLQRKRFGLSIFSARNSMQFFFDFFCRELFQLSEFVFRSAPSNKAPAFKEFVERHLVNCCVSTPVCVFIHISLENWLEILGFGTLVGL